MAGDERSLSLELRSALFQEGPESLLRIGHGEEPVLQLPFEGETLVERHLRPLRHGSLDESHRSSGMLRVREALREGHRLVPELRPWEDAVEQAPFEGV